MSRMENAVNNIGDIVTDAQKDYNADKRKFHKTAKSRGMSDLQIGEQLEELERNASSNVLHRLQGGNK